MSNKDLQLETLIDTSNPTEVMDSLQNSLSLAQSVISTLSNEVDSLTTRIESLETSLTTNIALTAANSANHAALLAEPDGVIPDIHDRLADLELIDHSH